MNHYKSLVKSAVLAIFCLFSVRISAQDHNQPTGSQNTDTSTVAPHSQNTSHGEEDYFGSFVFHHIGDDYSFQVFNDIYVWLPVIIFEPGNGFDVFLSKELHQDGHSGLIRGKYLYEHGQLTIPEMGADGHPVVDEHGHPSGKTAATLFDLIGGNKKVFYNFSITKNVFGILLACSIIMLIFFSIARRYKRNPVSAPKGLQGMMEILIVYIQDEVVKPSIGKKYAKFLPYLLTLFFFIWINNVIGLIPIFPGGANVTGNVAVTMTLAILALVLQVVNANKNFWAHIFWFPGVPVPVKILLAVIEFVGLFSKPFALMIRLFANITAGHIIIMSIIGISFVLKNEWIGLGASIFSVAMYILEMLVAIIQAYIFTLLTALMIGAAVEEPHGHDAHHGHEPAAAH